MNKARAHAIGWAAVVIGALTILRFVKGAGDPPYGVDASYYFQLARHVMRGEGLITTVSLYHEGWMLPARTSIYPLWPLILGYSGRVFELARVADVLPRLFYVVDVVLMYVLARAVAVRLGGLRITDRWWVPDTAHWMVLIFGLAPLFYGATTHPYTEGVAFAAALASFLALERFERTRGVGAAALSGVFAGLAFLARTQMVGVAVGCFLALAWFAIRDARTRAGAAVWALAAIATITPWIFFIGYIPGITASTLPRVTLPRFAGWTESATRMEWLARRVGSVSVMFHPSGPHSYVQSFGVVAYLVPLAAIVALAELVRRRAHAASGGDARPPLLLAAIFIAGLFFFLNLTLYHSEVWMPWLFGWRHGLPYIFLITLAVPYLVARSSRFAGAIALVLLISVATSASAILAFIRTPDPRLTAGESELVRWLPATATVISTNAQVLGSMSDARMHWTYCDAPGETTTAMLRAFPVDYVLMYEHETRCRFVNEAGRMRLVAAFGEPGRRLFVLEPLRKSR